jgi:hypothetical protein
MDHLSIRSGRDPLGHRRSAFTTPGTGDVRGSCPTSVASNKEVMSWWHDDVR